MKVIKSLKLMLIGMLLLNSCYKDDSRPYDEKQAIPASMENLAIQSTFDWKTTKKYKITIRGNVNNIVKITSESGVVYQKVFLVAGTDCVTIITLPAYEKNVHLVYNGQNVELILSSAPLTYTF